MHSREQLRYPTTDQFKWTITSTPFEMVYQQKPDLCTLFPMFSVAYVSKLRDGAVDRLNMHSKMI